LSSRCPTLFDETCGSKFKGLGYGRGGIPHGL